MKNSCLALAVLASSLGFLACSDDSSKPTESEVVNSSASVSGGGDIPAASSSSTSVVVDDPDAAIVSVPNETVATTAMAVSGTAAVGPMYAGATVSATGFDPATFTASGTAVQGTVSSDMGVFALSGSVSSPYVTVSATGSYYNYILDEKYGPITLEAVSNISGRTELNVNVLTHVEAARVKQLVTAENMTFNDAKIKAEKEIRLAFGLPSDSTLFEDISLTTDSQAGANLLAVTSSLMGEYDGTTFITLLNKIRDDIALDGTWDDESSKATFGDYAYLMPINATVLMLKSYLGQSIKYFETEVTGFWGIQYGLGFCLDEGSMANNTNSFSTNVGKTYMCSNGAWSEASEEALKSIALTSVFGACTAELEGTMNQSEGAYYVCKKNFWVAATADEIGNSVLTASEGACDDSKYGKVATAEGYTYVCVPPSWTVAAHTPIDYSAGRKMNKLIGKGINFGNSWDATGSDDSGWSNPIQDGDFATVKAAGFNSVRIPVRWYTDVNTKLSGVKADVDLALAQGLIVIIDFHHYEPMWTAAKDYPSGSYPSEKQTYLSIWETVSKAFSSYPDDKVILEILNEPRDMSSEAVNDLMMSAYEVIRKNCPGKTIMFEGNGYSKFAQISYVTLPEDGNIIFTGHYYEPYEFSHQGNGYDCTGDATYANTAAADLKRYKDMATVAYPDINGGHVPLNMGEFGVAGKCNVTDASRAKWTKLSVQAAEANDMSWNYWCFKNCGGFESYNGGWISGFLDAFGL